ncbi:YitT family protein [Paenibacillus contaminans]|uniref:YitT family protein n=1 Tax=Paenibacillus contaminans TaxID=450362 RepID=UPI00307CC362
MDTRFNRYLAVFIRELVSLLSLQKLAVTVVGSLLLAIGINFFLVPFMVLDGGVIGISLIANYLFGIKIGLSMLLSSLPIFVLAWFYDRAVLFNSLHGLLLSSYFIDLLEPLQYYFLYEVELTPFSSSALGGWFIGAGIGIMLRYGASTGGTDMLAHLLAKIVKINVGIFVFIIDGIIVSLGGLLISPETFLLSIVSITAGGIATSLCTMRWKRVRKTHTP